MEFTKEKTMKDSFNKSASIRTRTIRGYDVHIVDSNSYESLALLSTAYTNVYEPAFPIDTERESLDTFLGNLAGKNPNVNIVIAIVGDDLGMPCSVIKGLSVGYYYNKEDVGLMAYNAIAPEARNQGLGYVMVEARKQALFDLAKIKGGTLKGVFLECNDPEKVKPEEDSFDPAARLAIFQKWGAKILPVDYVQPPLAKGAESCHTLKLLAYPHPASGEYPTPEGIKGFIRGIYAELAKYSPHPPEKNPYYIRTMQQINVLEQGSRKRDLVPPTV